MDELLKKFEDQLNCPICLDTYTDPKQLQCSHVYCQQCLVKLVIRDQQGRRSLICPHCRQVTPVPANGVRNLLSAYYVNQFLEIVKEHKKIAKASSEEVVSASASPTPPASITVGCPGHGGKEVELYCETCGKTICWECIMKGSEHHSHEYDKLDKAFERYKEEITASLEPLEKQLKSIKKALEDLDIRRDEVSNQRATIEASIHDTIARLYNTLDARKTELISQLHRLTQDKLKSLAVQRDQIETTQAQLSSCLLFMRENLKTDNQAKALLMKSTTVQQVKKLTTSFQPDALGPNTEADMIFLVLDDLSAKCRNYGVICTSDQPKYKIVEDASSEVGDIVIATLQVLDSTCEPHKVSTASISCELISDITGTRTSGSIKKRGQGLYKISYKPTIKGRNQLHVKVGSQHIIGSPFPVTVWSPVEKLTLGTPILTIDELREPVGVAVNQRGEVVVTEWNKHCVTMLSPSGERLWSFGSYGTDKGQLNQPIGVAIDRDGSILVADYLNHRIQKLTTQGKFLSEVVLPNFDPYGLALNASNGKVYVMNSKECRVVILNSDLSYYGEFGGRGKGKGQFRSSCFIACDSCGNVYVADNGNCCIQVFTAEGEFLRMFGKGEYNIKPTGIAVDFSDKVYVCDTVNQRIVVFTSEGQLVAVSESKLVNNPHGLAVDSSGVVYVCDRSNGCVKVF